MEIVIKSIEKQISELVLFRGTKSDIIKKINAIGQRNDSILEPFEKNIKGNDFGFNTNLGELNGHYLDFEIYLLPTNKKDIFIITEINPF